MDDLIILVPSYNEEKNLKKFISKKYNFLILDDCSTDQTSKYFTKKNIKVIKNNKKQGYEKNILNGINYVKNRLNKEYIMTIDGDGEHPVEYIKKIYNFYKKNLIQLFVTGQKIGLWNILFFFFNIRFKIKDPFCGMKIYKTDYLYKIINSINDKHFLAEILPFYKTKKNFTNFDKTNDKQIFRKQVTTLIQIKNVFY